MVVRVLNRVVAPSASPHTTKQPYLGWHCLPQSGDGPGKGGLKIAHSKTEPDWVAALRGHPTLRSK